MIIAGISATIMLLDVTGSDSLKLKLVERYSLMCLFICNFLFVRIICQWLADGTPVEVIFA